MKARVKIYCLIIAFVSSCFLFLSFLNDKAPAYKFAYKQAGLTEREAAAHLLNRFTYGPQAGDVDKVVEIGLEKWFDQQLKANHPDDLLREKLSSYDALNLSNTQVLNQYPKANEVRRMALKDGLKLENPENGDKKKYRSQLEAYMKEKGFQPQQELFRQFISQKVLRASYSDNQLQELLTDFWFNHFNVSLNKNQCAEFIPAYERDVIRPNVLGKFDNLLLATAKSPAMLMYLDNFSSMGVNEEMEEMANNAARKRLAAQMQNKKPNAVAKVQQKKKTQGLNENYAREVMELHTLGVDGGYTQSDVTQAARVLTGWMVYPMSDRGYGSAMKNILNKMGEENLKKRGFVHDGDFLFAANRHDTKDKIVLGKKFPAGGGYEEGVQLLNMLASHPSTAKFISRKLAVRFVNDNPSEDLVNKMAKTFSNKNGDIKQVLITMVSSPEFWSKEALREKTKSPFELAISAVRGLNADVFAPYQLYTWVTKMGQKLYYYQAPTGFPDNGQYWINTGSLLNRMNFGLALASQKIPGVRINLAKLNQNREPESAEAALLIYSKLIMPERNLDETLKRLTPMLNDPKLLNKVEAAATKASPVSEMNSMMNEDAVIMDENRIVKSNVKPYKNGGKNNNKTANQSLNNTNSMLAQVVGVIIGSPEFQRK
ncbi:MAG: DUF1800 domain-containing protein [Sphingobacteriaceae bacterium]